MKNYILLICIVALISLNACVKTKTRLHARQAGESAPSNVQELQRHIPKSFWVDERGQQGNNFVAFMTRNNTFLHCNPQTNMLGFNNTSNLTQEYMFTPEMGQQNNTLSLKTRQGKYLGLLNDRFMCNLEKADNNTLITFERSPRVPGMESMNGNITDTLAMKFNRGYLGYMGNLAMMMPNLNSSNIFLPPIRMNRTS